MTTEPDARGRRDRRAWWSSRFLALIEGMSLPESLRAGRALMRTEAVLSVRRSGNLVVAMVRDRGDELYKPRLAVRTFGDADWGRLEDALAAEARYAAALLAGSMPADLEDVFAAHELSLFPRRADDLAMDCTCTDWQRPCAHLVAACHQLADTIDLDPFALLALRGRERDALLAEIRRRRPRSTSHTEETGRRSCSWPAGSAGGTAEPLPTAPSAFWTSPVPAVRSSPVSASQSSRSLAGRRSSAPDQHAPAVRPDILLQLCGPLVVEPFGDLRDELRPAYRIFATPGAGPACSVEPGM
ncbi:SWIM zinc finger family protein [Parafrankia elaeagni]|uniref:SWIM zinc finger family protein n=1 Tax=Parafrankia elaeagni TaxID=222534 RepID=UPI0003663204|nr:hypothetical protein [Parafrankia elaeagni]